LRKRNAYKRKKKYKDRKRNENVWKKKKEQGRELSR
jgi:hypothetical protein